MTTHGAWDSPCDKDLQGDMVLASVSGCGLTVNQLRHVTVSFSDHVQLVQLVDGDDQFGPSEHSLVVEQPIDVSVGGAAVSSSVSGTQTLVPGHARPLRSSEEKVWSPRTTIDKWLEGLEGRRHVAERPFGAANNPPCLRHVQGVQVVDSDDLFGPSEHSLVVEQPADASSREGADHPQHVPHYRQEEISCQLERQSSSDESADNNFAQFGCDSARAAEQFQHCIALASDLRNPWFDLWSDLSFVPKLPQVTLAMLRSAQTFESPVALHIYCDGSFKGNEYRAS